MTIPRRLTDRKRQAIVRAAIAEFRTNGFENTSMDRIAASAEVSKRTVYNHFPSKEDLFAEILKQLWSRSATEDEPTYLPDRGLRVQLIELLQHKMTMLSDPSFLDLVRVVMAETIHKPERARDIAARIGDKEMGVVTWIKAAQAHGKLKPVDAAFAATQLHGMLKTFAFWPQVTMGEPPLSAEGRRQVLESTIDMFLGCYEVRA